MELHLCDRAGVSWLELQELPAAVVLGYLLDMAGKAKAAEEQASMQRLKGMMAEAGR